MDMCNYDVHYILFSTIQTTTAYSAEDLDAAYVSSN